MRIRGDLEHEMLYSPFAGYSNLPLMSEIFAKHNAEQTRTKLTPWSIDTSTGNKLPEVKLIAPDNRQSGTKKSIVTCRTWNHSCRFAY